MANCICKLKKNRFNNLFETTDDFDKFAESVSNFCSFITIDDSNLTDFKASPDYKPDSDEWFYLEIDGLEDNITRHIDTIYEHFRSSTDLSDIDSRTLNDIKLVMYGEETEGKLKINFQVITKSRFIKEDKFLVFDNGTKILENNKISSLNLKKISFYKGSGVFQKIKDNPDEFLVYMKKFDVLKELLTADKISIQSDDNMKIFMKACSQQVYQGDFTGDFFMANTNKKID